VYLKQIDLENFKSFGGKLSIPLMEGYMAVTGPNGSGKSNITDAILFVLGPKSSKAVRAGKLTDLIFDGGKGKGKAGFTKVSLVFDNSDRLMPWDDDTVRLTRHVKMADNGVDYSSYFYVNDRKSSLTEFDSLLTKARISADGYNMVQQGDVTRIVQMGNLERRRVLDGISGIASYDADIEKARAERAEAEANLDRINIVVEELVKQIERLEKDREDAKRYMEAQRLLDVSRAQLVHRQLIIAEANMGSVMDQIGRISAEIASLRERKGEVARLIGENREAVAAKEREIGDKAGPEYMRVKGDIEAKKLEAATKRDRIERIADDRAEHEACLAELEGDAAESGAELDAVKKDLAAAAASLESLDRELRDALAEEAGINEDISRMGGEHAALRGRLSELDVAIEKKEKGEREAELSVSRAETVLEGAVKAISSLREKLEKADFEIKDAEWNLQQVRQQAGPQGGSDLPKKIMEAKRKEAEYERQENELKDAITRLNGQYQELMAEKRVADRAGGKSSAVTSILSLRDTGAASGIRGTIQELATVKQGYETAIAVAAGSRAQAVVVDDDQVAADCISYLKKEKLGRVTFLPLNKMRGGRPDAKAIMAEKQTDGYATSLMTYDQRYANAFWEVFRDTLIVSGIPEARALMGGVRLVTRGGEVFEKGGAIIGGMLNTQSIAKFGASSESKLEETGSRLSAANTSMNLLRVQMRQLRDEIRSLDDEMRREASEGMGVQAKISQLDAQAGALRRSRQALAAELEEKLAEEAAARREAEEAREALYVISEEAEGMRGERREARERMDQIAPAEIQERLKAVRDKAYGLSDAVSTLKADKTSFEAKAAGLEKLMASLEGQIATRRRKIEEGEAEAAGYEEGLAAIGVELDALRRIEEGIEEGMQDLKSEKDALVGDGIRLDGERESLQTKIEDRSGFLQSQEAAASILESNIAQIRAEMSAIAIEVPEPIPSEEEIKRSIRSCEGALAKIGNVNLRAIEEYDERKARHDGLIADVASLNRQIKDLNGLTESLNGQKKGLFMQSYDAVNVNFKAIYAMLSGGGEAFMGLEDEEDPFLGGLTINAKPKNGKLLRLEALSGGEKSLTALAFIFAIQEYQPSPFYVLDEVDMFLDSVNAEMVARRVKESSRKAQFIQVSLRKVTLSMADHLIGVTRPPTGISRVIMQPDLAEVSKYEEEALRNRAET
jgi:chromosome segregation protein